MIINRESIKLFLKYSFVRFFIVGGLSTMVQFTIFIVLIEEFAVNLTLSSVCGYLGAAICNYLMNYYYTFAQASKHHHAIIKFALVVFIGANVNIVLFTLFLKIFSEYLLVQCFAVLGTLIVNYTLHKHWIYKGNQQ